MGNTPERYVAGLTTGDRLVNTEAAGLLLGLRPATIAKLRRRGDLPAVRPTGRRAVRYRLSDIEALIRRRSVPAGA